MPNYHGLTAFAVLAHVRARYFPPQIAGLVPALRRRVFRIDHDQAFNQTTHVQYQPWLKLPGWHSTGATTAAWWRATRPGQLLDASSFLDADQQTAIGCSAWMLAV